MVKTITTRVPGHDDISLVAWYEQFANYYPNCEPRTKSWFVNHSQTDWVYLDCGANIGYYSILFSRLSPEGAIHAVEPTSTFDMLTKNLDHNHIKNVTPHRVALGASSGDIVDSIFRIWGTTAEQKTYTFVTVDDLVNSIGLTRLDVIKIDVDSYDYEVLLGSRKTLLKFDPWVLVELNSALEQRGHNKEEAFKYMRSLGYQYAEDIDGDNFLFKKSRSSPSGKSIDLSVY